MKKVSAIILIFLTFCFILKSQHIVTGTITNSDDYKPIPGATVMIKGTETGTISDLNGKYKIQLSKNDSILVFNSVGFLELEINANKMTELNISLQPEQYEMEEVVVIGYGTVKKKDLTGAIDKVNVSELQQTPSPTFETALQGKTSGVFMSGTSGKLGEAFNIRIRGTSSVSASAQPLYIIDNVVIPNDYISTGENQPLNPLITLDVNDIATIEILKDAEACAIYGSRAANGVVIITTKNGNYNQKNSINAGLSFSIQKETNRLDMLNGKEYKELLFESVQNVQWYKDKGYSDSLEFILDELLLFDESDLNNSYDWQDEIFRKGKIQDFYINTQGGTEKISYYAGFSYSNQEGFIIGNDFERINGRLSFSNKINKYIDYTAKVNYAQTSLGRVSEDYAFANPIQLIAQPPVISPYLEDGEPNPYSYYQNSLINIKYNDETNKINRTNINLNGNINIIPERLKFTSIIAFDVINQDESVRISSKSVDGFPNGIGKVRDVTNSSFSSENYFTFNEAFSEHKMEFVLGYSYTSNRFYRTNGEAMSFPGDDFRDLDAAAKNVLTGSLNSETYFNSTFVRAHYKYMDKYLASASLRRDNSSRFGPDKRAGIFYALSAGWILSEENFIKDISAISFLKPRISYGTTGNANIPDYSYLNLASSSLYAGMPGVRLAQLGRSDLGWENTAQFDIGIDYGFLNNRISGEIDYYVKNTSDLLLYKPESYSNGIKGIYENIGELKNKGFEIVINGKPITGEISWDISFNLATNENEVTKLIEPIEYKRHAIEEGKPLGFFKMPEYAGVDPDNGDALYYDENGNKTYDYTLAEWRMVGNPNPHYYGGISNRVTWKDFDMTIFFQYVGDIDAYRIDAEYISSNADWFDNQTTDQLNRWRKPGDITDVPQARFGLQNGTPQSSRYIEDASYIRLKELTIGYNLPLDVVNKVNMQFARIYFTVRNLFTITKYKGYDPENSSAGLKSAGDVTNVNRSTEFFTAPQAKVFTMGINVSF